MRFDFCIGNPPYQDNTIGDNDTYAPPVYDKFMDAAYTVADKVELIHPARFLFNAGSTPKQWNQKILQDEHFKILKYEADCSKVFSNTEIKGGLAISYRDNVKIFGSINIFTPFDELNHILDKVKNSSSFSAFSKIMVTSYAYHFTEKLYEDFPKLKGSLSSGHDYDLKSNVFEKMPQPFFTEKPNDDKKYIKILGRKDNQRTYRYILAEYVNDVSNLYSYKVFLPGATGNGQFGETISTPIFGEPGTGATETFLSVGNFKKEAQSVAVSKYIKTKFVRALWGVLKRTQANTPEKWLYVPLQDFTNKSDIDWLKSVPEIDQQLYKKYKFSKEEIDFIETNVKEME
jgi:hypothetical protein